ncbi:MAG: hypothetical protein JEZ09_12575 [Salinivirgaceae bacterium]|nr:hypothetical protein [Salinivirgaceae bacterium]
MGRCPKLNYARLSALVFFCVKTYFGIYKDNYINELNVLKSRIKELEKQNKELQLKNSELENYHTLFIEREFRIKELCDLTKEYETSYNIKPKL